jgi:hypothetical protein
MTKPLEQAFREASKLPEKAQDALGIKLLDELALLEDEAKWDEAFAHTQDELARWAEEVRADIKAGHITPLDFDRRGK